MATHPERAKEPLRGSTWRDAPRALIADVRRWVADGFNLGVRTGAASGVWVLDVDLDVKTGEQSPEWAALFAEHGLPATYTVRSPSGGLHYYFRLPESVEVRNDQGKVIAPGVDIRGINGYVVAPGCFASYDKHGVHFEGTYDVIDESPVAATPEWIVERFHQREDKAVEKAERAITGPVMPKVERIDPTRDQMARDELNGLFAMVERLAALPEGASTEILGEQRGWERGDGFFTLACKIIEVARWPHTTVTVEDAQRAWVARVPGKYAHHEWSNALDAASPSWAWGDEQAGVLWDLLAADVVAGPTKQVDRTDGLILPPSEWAVRPSTNWAGTSRALAKRIIRDFVPAADGLRLLGIAQGAWHYWDGTHWVAVDITEFTDFVSNVLALATEPPEKATEGEEPRKPVPTSTAGRIVGDLVSSGLAPELRISTEPGQRIGGAGGERMIALANGVLAVDASGAHTFAEPSPRFFNLVAGRYDYDETATCPTWEAWLAETFEHDPKAIPALQEWFGAFLLADPVKVQKMFWLLGPKRSGKGTIQGIARRLVGGAAATALRSFASQFGRENLVGHSLAIIDDSRDPRRDEVDAVVEFLLTYTSGGQVSIPRKNQKDWTGVLRQSLLAASNTPPRLADEGSAMATRMEVIQTRRSALGREDVYLQDRLATEFPGILNWSLVGLQRLVGSGFKFTQAEAADRVRQDVESSGTGAGAFVSDLVIAGGEVSNADLRAAIEWWTRRDSESGNPPHARAVKAAIVAEFPDARSEQKVSHADGERKNGWKGISLRCSRCTQPTPARTVSKYDHGPLCGWHLTEVGGTPASVADEADAFLRNSREAS